VDKSKLIKKAYFIFQLKELKLVYVLFENLIDDSEHAYWIPYSLFSSVNNTHPICSLADFELKANSTLPSAPSDVSDPEIIKYAELALSQINKTLWIKELLLVA
jgi:hypothetical protein